MNSTRTFYVLAISGIVFIIIGSLSVIDSNTPRNVSLDGKVPSGLTDTLTPIMSNGSYARIIINGSTFNFKITDPEKNTILSINNQTYYKYELIAKKEGEYKLETKNVGSSVLNIRGEAETKASQLAFGGQLMLIVTGIIILGLGIRSKIR